MLNNNKIFCIFCGDDDLVDKKSAIHHYWDHIQYNLHSSTSTSNLPPPSSNQITSFAKNWTSTFIDSLEESSRKNKNREQKDLFRHCPVCIKRGDKMIQGLKTRKSDSEKNHMMAHLKYKKYLCKICSRESNVPYPTSQLVAFHEGSAKNKTIHRIKSTTCVEHFNSCKSTKKSVVKHIRDVHLGPELSSFVGPVVDVDQLVVEFGIYAVEQLIGTCYKSSSTQLKSPFKRGDNKSMKKSKELVIINSDESRNNFKLTIEPMNPEVLAQGRNSLLKPNFNFSPIFEKSRSKSKGTKKIKSGQKCKRQLLCSSADPHSVLNDHTYNLVPYDQELDRVLDELLDREIQSTTKRSTKSVYRKDTTLSNPTKHKSYQEILDMINMTDKLFHFDVDDDVLNQFTSDLKIPSELVDLGDIEDVINNESDG